MCLEFHVNCYGMIHTDPRDIVIMIWQRSMEISFGDAITLIKIFNVKRQFSCWVQSKAVYKYIKTKYVLNNDKRILYRIVINWSGHKHVQNVNIDDHLIVKIPTYYGIWKQVC